MITKKVLIISYNFPPKGGVSSRRWIKFSKSLNIKGVECHIVTRDGNQERGINWTYELEKLTKTKIYTIKNCYPRFLERQTNSVLIKGLKFIGIKFLKRTFFKIDSAQYLSYRLIKKSKEIIKTGVNNTIVSGPPHSLMYQASILKIENPNINLILDYRDSWNDQSNYKLYEGINSFKSKSKSIWMENIALSVANRILFITEDMKNRMESIYPTYKSKFLALHNFFDSDDFCLDKKKNSMVKNIVYFGTLGSNRREALGLIIKAINKLLKTENELNFRFHFYTNEKAFFLKKLPYFNLIKEYFVFHSILNPKELYKEILKYEICLSINPKNYSQTVGAKIFDYMGNRKKIFHISDGGEIYDLLNKKNHYVANYKLDEVYDVLKSIQKKEKRNISFDFEKFELKKQTDKLYEIIF